MEEPLVSIIIPHWNHREVLADCLISLRNTEYNALEIIVVDNNSEDDSVNYVQEHFPKIHLIENSDNRGFAGGCNDGASRANGKYLVILNNDTTQAPNWIDHLVEYMESHPQVGVAQPKLINANNTELFDYSGAAGGFMDRYAFPFARGRIFDAIEKDTGQYDTPIQTFWASGTACILRREVYQQVGLFDETFFAHMEEIDMNWRAQLAGWQIAVVPQAVVYHHSGFTLPPESPLKKYLNHRNSVLMLLANYNLTNAFIRGIQRILLDSMALVYSLVSGDFDRVKAILKAWTWIMGHPGKIWSKRRTVKSVRTLSDRVLDSRLYQASIALEHTVFRKKKWERSRHGIAEETKQ